jgi:hypothetical protein
MPYLGINTMGIIMADTLLKQDAATIMPNRIRVKIFLDPPMQTLTTAKNAVSSNAISKNTIFSKMDLTILRSAR